MNCTFEIQMKKILALFFAVLYMTTTSGIVLNVHYCKGKVSSVKVENFTGSFCKCGKKVTSGSCCKTELKVLKGSTVHKATFAYSSYKVPATLLPSTVSLIDAIAAVPTLVIPPAVNAPPGLSSKTYLENCVFRI
jgi:hypothetical protein